MEENYTENINAAGARVAEQSDYVGYHSHSQNQRTSTGRMWRILWIGTSTLSSQNTNYDGSIMKWKECGKDWTLTTILQSISKSKEGKLTHCDSPVTNDMKYNMVITKEGKRLHLSLTLSLSLEFINYISTLGSF